MQTYTPKADLTTALYQVALEVKAGKGLKEERDDQT